MKVHNHSHRKHPPDHEEYIVIGLHFRVDSVVFVQDADFTDHILFLELVKVTSDKPVAPSWKDHHYTGVSNCKN